jgi:hypothetical protein
MSDESLIDFVTVQLIDFNILKSCLKRQFFCITTLKYCMIQLTCLVLVLKLNDILLIKFVKKK